jgi:hypothetical protein
MALPGPAKTLFDVGLRLTRTPVDITLQVTGRTDTALELTVDRLEAGVRSATGVIFGDDELKEQGARARIATRERERATDLREVAAEEAAAAERRVETAAADRRRENAKLDASARLAKAEATDASLDAEESAIAAEREAEHVKKAAAKAKKARKSATKSAAPKANGSKKAGA